MRDMNKFYLIFIIIFYSLIANAFKKLNFTDVQFVNLVNNTQNLLEVDNFVKCFKLEDGEVITKLRWFNITAIETKIDNLSLRQIADGMQLIQLWFSSNDLIDCEFTSDKKSIIEFHNEFSKRDLNSEDNGNITYSVNGSEVTKINDRSSSDFLYLTHYKYHHDQCHQLHKKLRAKYSNYTKIHEINNKSKRWKRDLLVLPGTNWCGKNSINNGKKFEDLGTHSHADRCCRDHDGCKYTIGPFSWKYKLFNYRFHYVSHCSCDERFRSCLKIANTGAANLVGKLFFNVVQTKCFLFRSEKLCAKRSWWGKCLRARRKKRAHFRAGMKY